MSDNEAETSIPRADEQSRERPARSVESLFLHCNAAKNPVLAFSRACSKVGYLARDGERDYLSYLESALNEQKLLLLMQRLGKPEEALHHRAGRDRDLRAFQRAVARPFSDRGRKLATPELVDRIERNLTAGQWVRARTYLDDLLTRTDHRVRLTDLDSYPRADSLRAEIWRSLQDRIIACNAAVRARAVGSEPSASSRQERVRRAADAPDHGIDRGVTHALAASPGGAGHSILTPAADRDELERFKRQVSLLEFAASKGYELDPHESSTSSKVLRHDGTNDKIIVGRARDGHWQYFSVRDRDDNGTIIDFIQHRERKNLGELRQELREWTHTARPHQVPAAHRLVEPYNKDRARVALELAQAQVVSTHAYLTDARGLDPRTLYDERFRATWKQAAGSHRNVLFPHRNQDGLCGFEIKNAGFTGFAKGGERGLWSSNARLGDRQFVITESAIDALSYHQLHPRERTRYASTGGALSTGQSELLDHAVARMTPRSAIVAATDKDPAGHALAEHIRALCAKHPHVTFERHAPELGKDWNDHLRALRALARSGPISRDASREIGR